MKTGSSFRSSRSLSCLALALALSTGGCATAGASRPLPASDSAGFVEQQMGGTIASIEKSLGMLVELERGDEGPRKANALGSTVAGAAGPALPAVAMPDVALPASPLGQARLAQVREQTRQDLSTRVRVAWTGDAQALLRQLSGQVGFRFSQSGAASPLMVHVDQPGATLEQVLRDVASQIDDYADIKVDTASREVSLVYKVPSR